MSTAGLYCRVYRPVDEGTSLRPAVFLDRDGVVVEDVNYLHRVEDTHFIPGSLEAIVRLNRAAVPVVIVTNQAGIGRRYYDWPDFESVEQHIEERLAALGGWIDGVWACAYHVDGLGEFAIDHPNRKPGPGMLLEAAARLRIDLSASWLVGDKTPDIEAAVNAGLRGAVLAETGYGQSMRAVVEQRANEAWSRVCAIHFSPNLEQAVDFILSESSGGVVL